MHIEPMVRAVDWPSLSHAYGPAKDTPGHLRALLAEDADRVAAYDELNGSIRHQNTVYDATGLRGSRRPTSNSSRRDT